MSRQADRADICPHERIDSGVSQFAIQGLADGLGRDGSPLVARFGRAVQPTRKDAVQPASVTETAMTANITRIVTSCTLRAATVFTLIDNPLQRSGDVVTAEW
jgi:hypothetical protein